MNKSGRNYLTSSTVRRFVTTFSVVAGVLIMPCLPNDLRAQQPTTPTNSPRMETGTELSARQQHIVLIAALTAKGELQKLHPALNSGLDAGLTINEIKEVLVHLYAYCGFPRSIRGLQTLMAVLDERKKKGITDTEGRAEAEAGRTVLAQVMAVRR